MEELKHPGHLSPVGQDELMRDYIRILGVTGVLERQEESLKDLGHAEAAELVGVSLDAVKGEARRYRDLLMPAEDDA